MSNTTRYIYIAVAVIIAIIIVNDIRGRNSENRAPLNGGMQEEELASSPSPSPVTSVQVGNSIRGVLRASDNELLGNLKVVSPIGDIYVRTQRDFSTLLNREVVISIDGTLERFTLVDIQPAQ